MSRRRTTEGSGGREQMDFSIDPKIVESQLVGYAGQSRRVWGERRVTLAP